MKLEDKSTSSHSNIGDHVLLNGATKDLLCAFGLHTLDVIPQEETERVYVVHHSVQHDATSRAAQTPGLPACFEQNGIIYPSSEEVADSVFCKHVS
jgi:hypothetical protein